MSKLSALAENFISELVANFALWPLGMSRAVLQDTVTDLTEFAEKDFDLLIVELGQYISDQLNLELNNAKSDTGDALAEIEAALQREGKNIINIFLNS